jgi:dihydrofolate reductase
MEYASMRKLILQQWSTVDNIIAEEDGGLSFVDTAAQSSEEYQAIALKFLDTVDTMILGSKTYAMSKDYWPNATDQGEYGEKLNNLKKIVASRELQKAPWGDFPACTITDDAVAAVKELKEQDGKDIWLWGSLTVMKDLFDTGLIDEVHLRICPSSRGKGRHLFHDTQKLKLLDATSFDNGLVYARYEVEHK